MIHYVTRLLSFHPHTLEVISSTLRLPTISQLIFPAKLLTGMDSRILLGSAKQFNLSIVPNEFFKETSIQFSLYAENGIELYMGISTENTLDLITPNVVGLKFTSEHIQAGSISLEILKSLFLETVPNFQVHHGSVYDQQTTRRLQQLTRRYLKDSKHRCYPLELHWINYFGGPMLNLLGRGRFSNLHTCSEMYKLHDGIMVILQAEPYDESNPDHRSRQAQAEQEMRFDELLES
ncbi:hypothetical protein HJG54_17810 [Leptolyngbya sp. NK1-12]|uniref:Uncharacterized protein n=1 Tax=Leptolyngbya sp. NK1-12 TaxID=2547451 RepID=A0AA97AJ45_9CYAN|nr:hypothetical protein [Leptolyngbya sp. NK1-12]WNZ24526.1 hypothetical protein HJG54_17810 [Leptolyngbya sp. NK1-12]